MIKTDGGKNFNQGIRHNIRGIQLAPKPCFQYDDLAFLFPKMPKCKCCFNLEGGRMRLPFCHKFFALFLTERHALCKCPLRNHPVIYLNALPVIRNRW